MQILGHLGRERCHQHLRGLDVCFFVHPKGMAWRAQGHKQQLLGRGCHPEIDFHVFWGCVDVT